MLRPVIVVHGGAWNIPDALVEGHIDGCRQAAEEGWRVLSAGGTAEDAVEAAIRTMEDDSVFDAGRGSHLNLDGVVELDAALMEGRGLAAGAVAGVCDIANPIALARRVMDSDQVLLIGEGASRFAEECGMARCRAERLVVPRELEAWRDYVASGERRDPWGHSDTVGAVAVDATGHLAAGTSTGGTPFKVPGRVGDVPCVGAGLYAEDALGAASSTGEGEAILRVVMAKRALDHLAGDRHPHEAACEAIAHLWSRVGGHAGLILLDRRGRMGVAFNTARMARAWCDGDSLVALVEPGEKAGDD